MSNPVLWFPSEERLNRANISAFSRSVERDYSLDLGNYQRLHQWSVDYPGAFWESVWEFCGVIAETRGNTAVESPKSFEHARWFPEARLNFAENLLRFRGQTTAIEYCREDGTRQRLSHDQLARDVSRFASVLDSLGVVSGDRIAGCLPNMPEAVIAALAAASIGACWSSCSPDFGEQAMADRFGQIEPRVLIAVDACLYNGRRFEIADRIEALADSLHCVEHLIVVRYDGQSTAPCPRGALWYHQLMGKVTPGCGDFEQFPFSHPLYILYSSGTTGAPKCIVHGAGGTLLQHYKEHQLLVDVHPGDRICYFTTCGWMMWNWMVSALASGATLVLFDGCPFFPNRTALLDLVDRAQINILGVSAGYIDALGKSGLVPRKTHGLQTLSTLLSTGSPLIPENYDYVYQQIKADVCLSSISGGTDIVSCFVAGPPTVPVRRGEMQCPGLGMRVEVFDEDGNSVREKKGELVCTRPFPSMPVGFWNDPKRKKYNAAYFSRFSNVWCHGDFAEITADGGVIIFGRSDSVLNPGGVRIGPAEIYRQVAKIPEILDSVAIAQEWHGDVRIVLFVRLVAGKELDDKLVNRVRSQIREHLSPRHEPAKVVQVADIPYTKSGKLVEAAVRNILHGREVVNAATLANPESLDCFRDLEVLKS